MALAIAMLVFATGYSAEAAAPAGPSPDPYAATPDGPGGPGSHPEATQGRVPAADYSNGRAELGYTCNTTEVGQFGTTGGYRTYQYTAPAGHQCAYYDTTPLFPTNPASAAGPPPPPVP